MPGRPVPGDDVQRARLRGRARRFSQWNGVAILSRVGIEDVEIGFQVSRAGPRTPRPRPARSVPRAAACGCGACTCRTAARWTTRICSTSSTGSPPCGRRPPGWLTDDPAAQVALVGDWNIAPQDDDVWDMSVFTHSTHVSEPERAAFRAIVEAGYADVVRPRARSRRLHVLGLRAAAFPPPRGHADRLRPRLPRTRRPHDRRADRPRGAQGQGRQRPRTGDRRPRLTGDRATAT